MQKNKFLVFRVIFCFLKIEVPQKPLKLELIAFIPLKFFQRCQSALVSVF